MIDPIPQNTVPAIVDRAQQFHEGNRRVADALREISALADNWEGGALKAAIGALLYALNERDRLVTGTINKLIELVQQPLDLSTVPAEYIERASTALMSEYISRVTGKVAVERDLLGFSKHQLVVSPDGARGGRECLCEFTRSASCASQRNWCTTRDCLCGACVASRARAEASDAMVFCNQCSTMHEAPACQR